MATTITDLAGLQAMKDSLAEDYTLGNDLNAADTAIWNSGAGFIPVGDNSTKFTGTFDGGGYTISNLTISRSGTNYIGLFGYADGATIQNITLDSPAITGDDYTGALVGYAIGSSTISNCGVSGGSVTGGTDDRVGGLIGSDYQGDIDDCYATCTVAGNDYVGGFMGYALESDVDDCYATGAVTCNGSTGYGGGFVGYAYDADFASCYATGAVTNADNYAGGFAGYDKSATFTSCYASGNVSGDSDIGGFISRSEGGTISKCYATGDITGGGTSEDHAGGFVGYVYSSATISDCYARGDVDCSGIADFDKVGGFVGYVASGITIEDCYSTGAPQGDDDEGGFCGDNDGTITTCYWDKTTSGTSTSDGGIGNTTAQMQYQLTYSGWDFVDTWAMDASHNSNYPYLGATGIGEDVGRSHTISGVLDEKGRVPKGAVTTAYRGDTDEAITTGVVDANGDVSLTGLPLDTDVYFITKWGGGTSGENNRWDDLAMVGVADGGTGSSTAAGAASNMGLGTGDSPHFTAVNIGHATDTTLAREDAGRISVEGNVLVRSDTYFIAANNAPLHVKKQADKTCNGTNDDVEVLAALALGKAVKCSEGTFYFEASITLDSDDTFVGSGKNTIFTTTTANLDIITATGSSGSEKTGITLADFCIDGDAGSATNDVGILWTYVDKSEIRNVTSRDNGESGIELYTSDLNKITNNVCPGNTQVGIYAYESSGNVITSNICEGNGNSGVEVTDSVTDNVVKGNICQGNSQSGILFDNTDYGTISGNTCSGNGYSGITVNTSASYNAITGNTCEGNTYYGIAVDTSSLSNSVTGNICKGNTLSGIDVNGTDDSTVVGNICRLNGRHGIILTASDNNLIANNNLTENSQTTTNTYDDIFLTTSDYNLVQGNICRAGGQTPKPRYGINISAATCDVNKVFGNDLYDDGFVTATYNDSGTGTLWGAEAIDAAELGASATYDDVQDYINFFGDSTKLSGGAITDAGSNIATVASLTGWCKITDSDTAIGRFFDFAGGNTGALGNDVTSYIYYDYNGGSPQLVAATSLTTYGTKQDHILLGIVFNDDGTLHMHTMDEVGIKRGVKDSFKAQELSGAERISGIVTTDGGTLSLAVSSGVIYIGSCRHASTIDGSSFSYWYTSDSGTNWTEETGQTALTHTYNNIASGKVSVGTGKYGVHWVFVDYDGTHMHVVYGQGNYNANQAEEATVPSVMPNLTTNYCILIAKVITHEGTNDLVITYPWTTVFTSSLATDHNLLGNLPTGDVHTQYFLVAGETTDAKLHSGADLIVYSDAGSTEKARIDGATGNITTSGTVDGVDVAAHAGRHTDGNDDIQDAAADDSTKGIATFEADDFDDSSGKIDLATSVCKAIAGDSGTATPSTHQATIAGTAPISTAGASATVTVSLDADGIDKSHLSQDFGTSTLRLHAWNFTPKQGKVFQCGGSEDPSPFTAYIDTGGTGGLTSTNIPYDDKGGAESITNEMCLHELLTGAGYWGRFVLHNKTKTESVQIVSFDDGNQRFVVEANSPDDANTWSDEDEITTQSQTCTQAGYMDLDLSDEVASTEVVGQFQAAAYEQIGAAGQRMTLHPFESYDAGKRVQCTCYVGDEANSTVFLMAIVSQKICVYWGAWNDMAPSLSCQATAEYADT